MCDLVGTTPTRGAAGTDARAGTNARMVVCGVNMRMSDDAGGDVVRGIRHRRVVPRKPRSRRRARRVVGVSSAKLTLAKGVSLVEDAKGADGVDDVFAGVGEGVFWGT